MKVFYKKMLAFSVYIVMVMGIVLSAKASKAEAAMTGNMTDICPAYESDRYKEYSYVKSGNTESFKLGGVTYKNGFTFDVWSGTWAVYNLNGRFDKFTATLCHVDGTNLGASTLYVFFDGVQQDELAVPLTGDMAPTSLDWNVTGVKQLKISLKESSSGQYGFGDPVLTYAEGKEVPPPTAQLNAREYNMVDILPAYQGQRYDEFFLIDSGGTKMFNLAGNTYKNGFTFDVWSDTWAVYNLNGRFDRLTATLCHVDGTNLGASALQVFFDGILQDNLSVNLKADMYSVPIDWNVTGVKQLKISLNRSSSGRYGFGDPVLRYAPGIPLPAYTVLFKDGGKTLNTQNIAHGKAAAAPANPAKAGHTFTGWDKPFHYVRENLVVNATWKTNTYTVTFKVGSKVIAKKSVLYGGTVSAPYVSSKPGYNFAGWNKSIKKITGNLTVKAKWKAKKITLTFYANGGKIGKKTSVFKKCTFGKPIKISKKPSRKRYKFKGWFTSSRGGSKITKKTKVPVYNTTYYAHWVKR